MLSIDVTSPTNLFQWSPTTPILDAQNCVSPASSGVEAGAWGGCGSPLQDDLPSLACDARLPRGEGDDAAIRALVVQAVQIEYRFQEMDRQRRQRGRVEETNATTANEAAPATPNGSTGILSRDICRSIIRTYASHVEALYGHREA
jgi:hypothetical protein